jgi:hypothetical protein
MRLSFPTAATIVLAALGLIGIWHAFPLIDVFDDEMYFAYGPLRAFQSLWPFPQNVPYGTVTFYLVLPLQAAMLALTLAYALVTRQSLEVLVMQNPHLAYIAPRALSVMLFVAFAWCTFDYLRRHHASAATRWIVFFLFGNLVLLTFVHSGKQWIASIVLLGFAGLTLTRSPRWSMAFAGLAFANFPMMGLFWLQTLVFQAVRLRKTHRQLWPLLAIALLVPAVVMALNYQSIVEQVVSIARDFVGGEIAKADAGTGGVATAVRLYLSTFGAYLVKLLYTMPITIAFAAVAFLERAHIRDRALFLFACIGAALYLLAVSAMFHSAFLPFFLRYLLPFPILAILAFSSLDVPWTRLTRGSVWVLGTVASYLAVVLCITLALPTTYNTAVREIGSRYNDDRFLILSKVSQISLPYNFASAEFTLRHTPDVCSNRCRHALDSPSVTAFRGIYAFVPSLQKELEMRRAATASGLTIVTVERTGDMLKYVSAESALGFHVIPRAWIPGPLGHEIVIREEGQFL